MSGTAQLFADTCETALLYSLIACGFYFASIATRHFCFAAATSFVIAPYVVMLAPEGPERIPIGLLSLVTCALIGSLYQRVSSLLSTQGAREGQLLIFSLATMGVAENGLTFYFGSASKTLWLEQNAAWLFGIAQQQAVVVVLATAVVFAIIINWRHALIGKVIQALIESRLNLSLRGFPIRAIELWLAAGGFACVGLAGLFWSLDGRIKPAMCTEVAVIGAVTFIIGMIVDAGVLGLVLAAIGLAIVRLILSLTLEGDWSMTAMLLLLGVALLFRRRGFKGIESAS